MDDILIYTDGSSRGNPGPGGWGAVVATSDHVVELGGFEAHTTNNRMELQAAHAALEHAVRLSKSRIVIRTDSAYVLQGATKWGHGWKRRGWKTMEGKDVLNRDVWEPFLTMLGQYARRVTWEKVGGHISIPGNERADEIATSYALKESVGLYNGPRSAYAIDLNMVAFDEEEKQKRTENKTRAKTKAYSYISVVGSEIKIHKTWDECKARVEGQKGAKYRKSVSAEDEANILQEFAGYITK